MEPSSNSLTSSEISTSKTFVKCQICYLEGHGLHYGAFTCRACAAFFRRCYFSPVTRRCRNYIGKCGPNREGRWFCKPCRLERCWELGMSTSKMEFKTTPPVLAKDTWMPRVRGCQIVEPSNHAFNSFPTPDSLSSTPPPLFGSTQPVKRGIRTVLTPNMVRIIKKKSHLEQMAQWLKQTQSGQKKNLAEFYYISLDPQWRLFERNMSAVATWLRCSDWVRSCKDQWKVQMLQSIWQNWGRLENVAITARVRTGQWSNGQKFLFSTDGMVDYESMKSDVSCWSPYKYEEMKYFLVSREIFYDGVISGKEEVSADDVELTFIMCILCFYIAEIHFSGYFQQTLRRLQDVLSHDLQEYYRTRQQIHYLFQLKNLMKIKKTFITLRSLRVEKYKIGGTLKLFNISFSKPEYFWFPP